MKKHFAALALLAALSYPAARSQDLPYQKGLEPQALTPGELFVLSRIPELTLPEAYQGPDAPLLPVSVDNSTQPYFRPITAQSGYECGQSAGIAFNFTYEVDRLRGLPANVPGNQYPTHFTWDFLNNANNYTGASFFDSWEIVRACGNMNVTDYGGGLNTGGYLRWISGYNAYYNGMHNRLNTVRAIRVDTPEGLLTLKYWLYDHLEGATVGGVANIYGQYFGAPVPTLPAGTPEAGKYVQTNWGGSPSHAWTICGFNDSIRYDFNGDGFYTNHIDINSDGVVDMHDWEKGGLKFANGYAGTGWCNSGYCYTMYKNLADNIGAGGIWNHTVYVLDVKSSCSPQLTMKVTLKHTSRNKLKVTAGINTDVSASAPSVVLGFPIFNYQGGDQFMQGGTTEADKTIEFGLDLAPLLSQINNNQQIKYFLQVQENDPAGSAAGEIVGWSLIDYTSTPPVVTNYPGANFPLQNNAVTRLGMTYTLNFSKPAINNLTLPPAQLYQPYTATLSASGGTAPYRWDAQLTYPEVTTTAPFPAVTSQQLTLTGNNSGYAIKTLGFNFPFYKKSINKVYVYADGFILFDDQPYNWPYLVDKDLLFRQTAILAPFMSDLTIYPSSGQGIWYEGNSTYAIFRWKASIAGMQGSTNLNVGVKLYPNGTIEYLYGDMVFPPGTVWTGGMSAGDNKNYQYSALSNASSVAVNTLDKFTTCGFPPEMTISEDGVFSGTPSYSYQNLPVKFLVTDNNNISSTKVLNFSTYGLLVNQQVISGGDSLIEFGETATITLMINNIGSQAMNQLLFTVSETDPWISLTDSTESVSSIAGGQSLTLSNAFTFKVSPGVPDHHAFTIVLAVQSQEQTFQRPLELTAHAPVFRITGTVFADGDNGQPEPGESADLFVTYSNAGSARATSVNIQLSSLDPMMDLTISGATIPELRPDSSKTLLFHAALDASASFEQIFPIRSGVTANNNFTMADTLYLFSGAIVEDFETGDFTKFPWYSTGQWPWVPEPGVKYEGQFASRSGVITDNAESILNLYGDVLADGEISFYRYVSCEFDPSGNKDYDYMAFFIDNFEMGRWDGVVPWTKETFPVTAGYHKFSWVFHKDYSVAAGWDGCLLDYIRLPLMDGLVPSLSVSPLGIEKTLVMGQTSADSVLVSNAGGGILQYSALVFDTTGLDSYVSSDNLAGSVVLCETSDFIPGQAFSWNFPVTNGSADNEYIRDIRLDLHPGVTVESATNYTGGSLGALSFLGSTGNGASLTWHGESTGGRGVIKPGETAVATLAGSVARSFMDDVFVVSRLDGDNAGTSPHSVTGRTKIRNRGLPSTWFSITDSAGSLQNGESDYIPWTIDAGSLTPADYRCTLAVRDYYNNKHIIPVTLHVTWPVGVGPEQPGQASALLGGSPNPFRDATVISYVLEQASGVTLEIWSMQGTDVISWRIPVAGPGRHSVTWNGCDRSGNPLPAGVYTCRMVADGFADTRKLILVR